jgi:class 3 adenylate cyclase
MMLPISIPSCKLVLSMRSLLFAIHRWLTAPSEHIEDSFANSNVVVNYAMFLGVFAHITILLLFVLLDQPLLVAFNIFSILIFVLALFQSIQGKPKVALTLATIELIAHAWLASLTLGLESFFYIYPLALLVLYPLMVWLSLSQRLLVSMLPICSTVLLYTYVNNNNIENIFSTQTTVNLAAFNIVTFSSALIGIMTYSVWATTSREEELNEEVTTRMRSEETTLQQLDRMLVLTNFSKQAAQVNSEADLLELYSIVVKNISASKCYELLLIDTNSGPFGTFYESVLPHPSGKGVHIQTIDENEALRASIAKAQGSELIHKPGDDIPFWFDDWHQQGFQVGVVMPLVSQGRFIGTLSAAHAKEDHFSSDIMLVMRQFTSVLGAGITLVRALRDLELSLSRSDRVLSQALPPGIAHRLKKGEVSIADHLTSAGVFFCDVAGFTAYSSRVTPKELVETLEQIFGVLEGVCSQHGTEKIKTIGDCFMAVSGVSNPTRNPAETIARFALSAKLALQKEFEASPEKQLAYRIGIAAGPVYAGIIGSDRLFFDIWGDTVNVANRMEQHGENGEVTCNAQLKEALGANFLFEDRGLVSIKGKGDQHLWALIAEKSEQPPSRETDAP